MKTKLILCILAFSISIGHAQKRSTYIVSPIAIKYQVLQPNSTDQTNSKNHEAKAQSSSAVQVTTNPTPPSIKTPKEEVKIEDIDLSGFDEQTKVDMYYIAYLIRTQLFDSRYQKEVEKSYDMVAINKIAHAYSNKELLTLSKEKSKKVKQYRL